MIDTWRERVERTIHEYGFISIVRGNSLGDTSQYRQLIELITDGRCDQCGGEMDRCPTAIQVAMGQAKAGGWICRQCGWRKP